MIRILETPEGELRYQLPDGSQVPVVDDQMGDAIASLRRLQKAFDAANGEPRLVTDALVQSGARALLALAATLGFRLQELDGAVEDLEPPEENDGITFSLDEARLVQPAIAFAVQALSETLQSVDPKVIEGLAPEQKEQAEAQIRVLSANRHVLSDLAGSLRLKIEARLAAEAEDGEEDDGEEATT